jgi:hypothetical protein
MDKVKGLIPEDVRERIGWMLDFATPLVQETYQKILNTGFTQMFVTVAGISLVGLIVAEFLHDTREI